MTTRKKLEILAADRFTGSLDELVEATGVNRQTVKKHLNEMLRDGNEWASKIAGFIPEASILVDLVERVLGKIGPSEIMAANLKTKEIVDGIAKPELKKYFEQRVPGQRYGEHITVSFEQLFNFLTDDFLPHVTETDNGFVSMVGRLNEEIILRALKNSSLVEGIDFQRTGQNSAADIIVSQRTGRKDNMYVEVKSYHARERLLRGLQDIDHPNKVGIGYFRDPSEFNPKRTQTLIDSRASAIYLPQDTYEGVDVVALAMTTGRQNAFYRPMSYFVGDMEEFVATGSIRDFSFGA